jgi:hypothetical protein
VMSGRRCPAAQNRRLAKGGIDKSDGLAPPGHHLRFQAARAILHANKTVVHDTVISRGGMRPNCLAQAGDEVLPAKRFGKHIKSAGKRRKAWAMA